MKDRHSSLEASNGGRWGRSHTSQKGSCRAECPGGERQGMPSDEKTLPSFSTGALYLLSMYPYFGLKIFNQGSHGVRENREKAPSTSPHPLESEDSQGPRQPHLPRWWCQSWASSSAVCVCELGVFKLGVFKPPEFGRRWAEPGPWCPP